MAADTPTRSAPASPGPMVAATTSGRCTPARSSARRAVTPSASRCAREAISGTTPPKRACSSTLEATSSASSTTDPSGVSSAIPTPVSSHELSIARMTVMAASAYFTSPCAGRFMVKASAPLPG
ncbi:Uncharacterised protein [Mycobacteroides abscessus subsp. abscessus]|nr:Uncharacterised protein [Mycobacteroides abscessus subsp. abscessus]